MQVYQVIQPKRAIFLFYYILLAFILVTGCQVYSSSPSSSPGVTPSVTTLPPSSDTSLAMPLPTPNNIAFAQVMVEALAELYRHPDVSDWELRAKAAFVAAEQRVAINYIYVGSAQVLVAGKAVRLLIVSTLPDPDRPFYSEPYFFWPNQDQTVSYQIWKAGEGYPADALQNPPMTAFIRDRNGRWEMDLIPQPIGSTADAIYILLRLENGQWREIWNSDMTQEWAGAYGRVEFVGRGSDTLRLFGPSPPDVPAPHFFIEDGLYERQKFVSDWQRQDDEYVRVSGQVIDSPLTALTEFILALNEGDGQKAQERVTNPDVIQHALRLDLDKLVPGEWVTTRPLDADSSNVLQLGHNIENGVVWKYQATFTLQEGGRWLLENIDKIP